MLEPPAIKEGYREAGVVQVMAPKLQPSSKALRLQRQSLMPNVFQKAPWESSVQDTSNTCRPFRCMESCGRIGCSKSCHRRAWSRLRPAACSRPGRARSEFGVQLNCRLLDLGLGKNSTRLVEQLLQWQRHNLKEGFLYYRDI